MSPAEQDRLPRVLAILLAAGRGTRSGQEDNKVFTLLAGQTVLERAARALLDHPLIDSLLVVLAKEEMDRGRAILEGAFDPCLYRLVEGGKSRQESSFRGLVAGRAWLDEEGGGPALALVHDAARCFLSPRIISDLLDTIRRHRCGAAPVLPVTDTIRFLKADGVSMGETLARDRLAAMQTPQGADLDVLVKAARLALEEGVEVTDDLELLVRIGYPVRAVKGDPANIKLTLKEDFDYARSLYEAAPPDPPFPDRVRSDSGQL